MPEADGQNSPATLQKVSGLSQILTSAASAFARQVPGARRGNAKEGKEEVILAAPGNSKSHVITLPLRRGWLAISESDDI